MNSMVSVSLTILIFGSVHSCFTSGFWSHTEDNEVDAHDEQKQSTVEGNPTTERDIEYKVPPINAIKYRTEHEGSPGIYPNEILTRSTGERLFETTTFQRRTSESETNDIDTRRIRPRSTSQRPRSVKRKKKGRRASIHVIPDIQSEYPLPGSFDKHGNINGKWVVESNTNTKMGLIIDSPKDPSSYNAAYIQVKRAGQYFIYGQVFFHGENHEMAHCLHVADTYKPCSEITCDDRKVMCSRSAPGHPETIAKVQNVNTNYIGGVVYLQKGSTIRLAIDVNLNINKEKAIELDKSLCYFGAFAV
ncbi:unnamed protein product [Owenia fusiformis]|uniref:THD domain-containing protein n=1 Tax=Owenia fusiformis TaxID=6347 RepID=A0A8J1THC5_OWEFU|nr:unnamed protein product [Owenia fusiformis]